jgi:hypothetical protein
MPQASVKTSRVTVKKNVPPGTRQEDIAAKVRLNPITEGGMRFAFPPYDYCVG